MQDIFGKKVKSLDDVTTIGDFKKLIKYAQSSKRAELGKEAAADWVKSSFWDELLGKIPGAATAKNAADALKSMYNLPDEARSGTALDNMDIDDDVAKIVDDPIENAFLEELLKELENMDDDAPMSNLNVTKGLANYLEKKFNARTVSGFSEGRRVRITKRHLRQIIKEAMPRGGVPDVVGTVTGIRGEENRRKAVELTDNPDRNAVSEAWPEHVYHNGKNVFETFYETPGQGIHDAISWISARGYEDPHEVYLGYDPQSDTFVMGFDAFEEDDGWDEDEYGLAADLDPGLASVDSVMVLMNPSGSPLNKMMKEYGGMYPSGINKLKKALPQIIDVRLD